MNLNGTNTNFTNGLEASKFFNIPNLTSAPVAGVKDGSLYYNPTTDEFFQYDGSVWNSIGIKALNLKEDKSNKVTTLTGANNITYPTSKLLADSIAAIPAPSYPVTSVNTRTGAVTGLAEQSALTTEVNRATAAEATKASQADLTAEVTNRTNADATLQANINKAVTLQMAWYPTAGQTTITPTGLAGNFPSSIIRGGKPYKIGASTDTPSETPSVVAYNIGTGAITFSQAFIASEEVVIQYSQTGNLNIVPGSIALQSDLNRLSLSVDPPTDLDNVKLNDLASFTLNNVWSAGGSRTFIPVKPSYYTGSFTGVVKNFYTSFNAVETGRVVRFYVFNKVGSTYTCTYDSGDIAADATGILTYTPPNIVYYTANDYIGVRVTQTTAGGGLRWYDTGGPSTEESIDFTTAVVVGSPVTGTITTRLGARYGVGAEITQANLTVSSYWGNKPYGYLKLDSTGYIGKKQLPTQVSGDKLHTETPTVGFLADKNAPAIIRLSGGLVKSNFDAGYTDGAINSTQFPNRVIIPYYLPSQGFTSDGILNEVRVGINSTVISSSKVQAWVVRLVSGKITLVEIIGELDGSVANRWHVFKGLSVFVKAGDMIAIRGIDVSPNYKSGSPAQTDYRAYVLPTTITDLSLNALNTPIAPGTPVGIALQLEADISAAAIGAKDNPGGSPMLDASLHFKNNIGKAPELYWQGKKIVWVGTSIPAGTTTGFPSYPILVGQYLDANVTNSSVGGSGVIWDGTRVASLSATAAELVAAYGAGQGAYSYENLMLGKGMELLVIDHGYNDRLQASGSRLGTLPWTDRTGNITTTAGSPTVTGAGTLFTTEFKVGDKLYTDHYKYVGKIQSINSNSSITLTANTATVTTGLKFYGTSMDRTTFYGAFNYLIDKAYDENPLLSIAFVTSPTQYAYQQNGFDNITVNTNARNAVLALANAYNAPVCDLMKLMNYNGANFLIRASDNVHPNQTERVKEANILYNWIKGIS